MQLIILARHVSLSQCRCWLLCWVNLCNAVRILYCCKQGSVCCAFMLRDVLLWLMNINNVSHVMIIQKLIGDNFVCVYNILGQFSPNELKVSFLTIMLKISICIHISLALYARFIYPPLQQSRKLGKLVSKLSICLSISPYVCGQNRIYSVSSILAWSISYLHILSSNLWGVSCAMMF